MSAITSFNCLAHKTHPGSFHFLRYKSILSHDQATPHIWPCQQLITSSFVICGDLSNPFPFTICLHLLIAVSLGQGIPGSTLKGVTSHLSTNKQGTASSPAYWCHLALTSSLYPRGCFRHPNLKLSSSWLLRRKGGKPTPLKSTTLGGQPFQFPLSSSHLCGFSCHVQSSTYNHAIVATRSLGARGKKITTGV